MKKSIAIFATVSLLSISASTFAFAETNTVKTMKVVPTKMEVSSSTKQMNRGKSDVAKTKIMKTTGSKKTSEATTTAH
jgi:hypothetical protein